MSTVEVIMEALEGGRSEEHEMKVCHYSVASTTQVSSSSRLPDHALKPRKYDADFALKLYLRLPFVRLSPLAVSSSLDHSRRLPLRETKTS